MAVAYPGKPRVDVVLVWSLTSLLLRLGLRGACVSPVYVEGSPDLSSI